MQQGLGRHVPPGMTLRSGWQLLCAFGVCLTGCAHLAASASRSNCFSGARKRELPHRYQREFPKRMTRCSAGTLLRAFGVSRTVCARLAALQNVRSQLFPQVLGQLQLLLRLQPRLQRPGRQVGEVQVDQVA